METSATPQVEYHFIAEIERPSGLRNGYSTDGKPHSDLRTHETRGRRRGSGATGAARCSDSRCTWSPRSFGPRSSAEGRQDEDHERRPGNPEPI